MTNTFDFCVGLINLILLLVGLKFVVISPMIKMTRERRLATEKYMKDAELLLEEAKVQLSKYEKATQDLEGQKQFILEKSRSEAEEVKAKMKAATDSEVALSVERAQSQAKAERSSASKYLRGKLAAQAVERARQLLDKSMSDSDRQNVIENFLAKVGADNA